MADRRLLLFSAIFCKLLLLTFILKDFKVRNKLVDSLRLFCGAKWDLKQFPTRKSGLPRKTLRNNLPPIDMQVAAIIGLSKATLFATQIVLLAYTNPGPMDICKSCNKGCRKKQKAIECNHCENWYHMKCINMANLEFLHLTNPKASWICIACICPLASGMSSSNEFERISTNNLSDITCEVNDSEPMSAVNLLSYFNLCLLNSGLRYVIGILIASLQPNLNKYD